MKSVLHLGFGLCCIGLPDTSLAFFHGEDAGIANGRALYMQNCAACHGANLEGQPDWQQPGTDDLYPAPPHDAQGHTWHHSDTVLMDYIALGGQAVLDRLGVAFTSGMPGFGDRLSPEERENILDFIKSTWPERERAYQSERTYAESD